MIGNKNSSDVIVIGGGIVGLSVALHFAEKKMKTCLIDKDLLVNSTSAGSVGALNLQAKQPNSYLSLSLIGSKYYEEFIPKLDEDIEYKEDGGITILETEQEYNNKMNQLEKQKEIKGYDLFIYEGLEINKLEDNLSNHIKGISYCPQEAAVNPLLTCWATEKAAKRLGVKFVLKTEILDIHSKNGTFSVVTKENNYCSPLLINCAGVGAKDIGKMLEVDIPVQPVRGQIVATEPIPELLHHYVATINQTKNGNIIIGTTNEVNVNNNDVEIEDLISMVKRAIRIVPKLKQVSTIRTWARSRPIPVDGLPIFGSVSEVPGFYIVVTHSGFVLGPLLAKLITELVIDGETSIPMENYSITRFRKER